jgi:hypothetical protein
MLLHAFSCTFFFFFSYCSIINKKDNNNAAYSGLILYALSFALILPEIDRMFINDGFHLSDIYKHVYTL